MSDLQDDDYNGACFVVGSAGEREERLGNRVVQVPIGMPFGGNQAFDKDSNEHKEYLDLFYRINYWALALMYAHPDAAIPDNGVAPDAIMAERARKVAYVRAMAMREGQMYYNGTATEHNVQYAEYAKHSWASLQDFARGVFKKQDIVITDLASARASIKRVPNTDDDRNWQKAYRSRHLNVVCMIAYFFRVRGHHWTDEMEDRYRAVWHKCLYEEDNPGLDWKYLAHDALHAIFPDDLDEIWREAVDEDKCAGALIKRFDSLPAGVAGVAAMNAGVTDLKLIVPKALDYSKEAVQHLDELTKVISKERWAGSINRRFYEAPELIVDETKLSALAAIIRSGLETFAPGSPLLKSKALQRIASNAAMTGAIVGRMVSTAVRSDAAAEIFLPEIRGAIGA